MKGKYSLLIKEYCEREGIDIPVGFHRGTANHLAIIRLENNQPKLVAKTFFNKTDIKYYIKHILAQLPPNEQGDYPALVIDFKKNQKYKCRLSKSGEGKLEKWALPPIKWVD